MIEVEEKDKTAKEDRPHSSCLPERFVLNATPSFNEEGIMLDDHATVAAVRGYTVGAKAVRKRKVGKHVDKALCKIRSVSVTEDKLEVQFFFWRRWLRRSCVHHGHGDTLQLATARATCLYEGEY